MPTNTEPLYIAAADLTVTSWGSGLADTQIGASAAVDNNVDLYVDVKFGGILESGTSPTDNMDVYVTSQYDESVSSAFAGGIDGLLTGADEEEVDATDLYLAGLRIFDSIVAVSVLGMHFGGKYIASLFNGMPETWMALLHNDSGVTMTTGSVATKEGKKWANGVAQ